MLISNGWVTEMSSTDAAPHRRRAVPIEVQTCTKTTQIHPTANELDSLLICCFVLPRS